MKKKIITFIIVIAVLAALAIVYAITSGKNTTVITEEETPTQTPIEMITNHDASAITKMNLKGIDADGFNYEVTLTRNNSGVWESEDYPGTVMKQSTVSSIAARSASTAAVALVTENADDLGIYGLETPRAEVTSFYKDGTEEIILLGNKAPGGENYYISTRGSSAVYTIQDYSGDIFRYSYKDFLIASAPSTDINSVERLKFYNGGKIMEGVIDHYEYDGVSDLNETFAERVRSSDLILTSPLPDKAVDLMALRDSVVEPLQSLAIHRIAEYNYDGSMEKYGFNDPKLMLELYYEPYNLVNNKKQKTGEKVEYKLTIGDYADESRDYSYATVEGLPFVFVIEESSLSAAYDANPYKMMDRNIAIIYIYAVDSLVFETSETMSQFKNNYSIKFNVYNQYYEPDNAYYDYLAPVINGSSVDEETFKNFYKGIVTMRVDSVIDDFTPDSEPEIAMTFKLSSGKDMPILNTRFYDYDANFYAVEQAGESVCHFIISKSYVMQVLKNLEALISK